MEVVIVLWGLGFCYKYNLMKTMSLNERSNGSCLSLPIKKINSRGKQSLSEGMGVVIFIIFGY